ncbi:DUF2336 domain-containing protein [Roseibium polysiphoniae]|uniref:DUF2336 domain-containing protein n=1 Tax=Roseibium polysiphoniae TaxID=2571221 RepID=A0ABR9C4Q9_9HYPH|nr:DUF2336 domain-containing protein [Roseibium polysiphoniae]MBD8874827.1 DUF2336 domain-containing protein [Roseibium polysiphoniae]
MNRLSVPSPEVSSGHETARRQSSPSHAEGVLLAASELFAGREAHDSRDKTLFRELALNLLPQTDESDRRRIACHLVRHPATPPEVLAALAADEDALTAYPVLRNAPSLDEDILVAQAERGPDSLRKAIAERTDASPKVLEILAQAGGPDVIALLLERTDIDLDEAMVSMLCKRPDILKRFGKDLVDRKVLTSSQMLTHFSRLDASLRQEAIASAELASLINLTRSGSHKPARPVFKQSLLKQLHHSALTGGAEQFAHELSYALGLPETFTHDIVANDSGETLSICLKALGFTDAKASQILVRLLGERLPLKGMRDLLEVFGNISHGAAMLLVNRWVGEETPHDQRTSRSEAQHLVQNQEPARPARSGDATWQELDDIEKLLRFG